MLMQSIMAAQQDVQQYIHALESRISRIELNLSTPPMPHVNHEDKFAAMELRVAAVENQQVSDLKIDVAELTEEIITDMSDWKTRDRLQHEGTYQLKESVWDAVLFIGITGLTIKNSCLVLFGVVANTMIQIGAIFMLALHLAQNPYDKDTVPDLLKWKACQEAAMSSTDRPALSLAGAGVPMTDCMSTFMKTDITRVYEDIENFFTPDDSYPAGWVMSLIATSCWVFALLVEFREICNFAGAVWRMPRGSSTNITVREHQLTLAEITRHRVRIGFGIAAIRLIIAGNLLYFGTLNLTYTPGIQDLMLNACAFAFVLDIDTALFDATAPRIVLRVIRDLDALPIPKITSSDYVPLSLAFAAFVFLALMDIFYLRPFVHSMKDIAEALGLSDRM